MCGPRSRAGDPPAGFLKTVSSSSAYELFDHFAAELGELLEAAAVEVGELVVVEAEEVEEGDVEVTDRVDDVDGLFANLVGAADHGTCIYAAAGEEDRHRLAVVVAAGSLAAAADTVVGGAAELAGPDDEGVIEEAGVLLERFPDSDYVDEALYELGWAHFSLGQFSEAIAAFERLDRLGTAADYRIDRAQFQVGKSYFEQQQYAEARVRISPLQLGRSAAHHHSLRSGSGIGTALLPAHPGPDPRRCRSPLGAIANLPFLRRSAKDSKPLIFIEILRGRPQSRAQS